MVKMYSLRPQINSELGAYSLILGHLNRTPTIAAELRSIALTGPDFPSALPQGNNLG